MARQTKADSELVAEARDFLQEREGAEAENRENMLADLRFAFVPGAQWDEIARQKRLGRPCYTYNRTVGAINQVIGDQRMTHPQGRVRALNDAGVRTAELIEGMIRDIEHSSSAEDIYDEAFKYAVAGGWGCWRVVPEYADGETFDQVIRIRRVPNPMTMFFDDLADPYGRGAARVLVADRISVSQYQTLYGGRRRSTGTNVPVSRDSQGWFGDKEIRIAEYYRRDCVERKIVQLTDGRVLPAENVRDVLEQLRAAGVDVPEVNRERMIKEWYVTWAKIDGNRVLEGPIDYPYTQIPTVRIPGRFVNIEGKQYYQSLILHSKDAQRTYNYDRSNMVETTALTPRAPWIVTAKMIKGYEEMWQRANISNAPFLVYDVDPDDPRRKPERNPGPDVPAAWMALAQHDAEDIRQTTGYVNPALDQHTVAGDAESGKALRTRLMTADAGTYEFLDNFGKAIKFTHSIVIDMIPVHMDTARKVRTIGLDGREQFQEFDPGLLKNAKYDVVVTLGPSYATSRMEALDTLLEAANVMPEIREEAPDIIVRNLDVKGATEIEQRIRNRLILAGKIRPTEADATHLPEPPKPDPTQEALARSLEAKTEKDLAAAEQTRVETQKQLIEAASAIRREQLELRKLFDETRQLQAETALLVKELRAPREQSAA